MTVDARAIHDALAAHGPFARILVAGTRGSAPREAGTAMYVWADRIQGTIGGGALEWRAMEIAREVLADGRPRVERMPLGPALGQCCGGAVTLVIERIAAVPPDPWIRRVEGDAPAPRLTGFGLKSGWMREDAAGPARRIHIWGAGHVGRALVDVLAPLAPQIRVAWHDIAPDRFPTDVAVAHDAAADLPARLATCARSDAHLIVTHSHDLDLALCHAALTRGFEFCGLIGSATKWARFRSRLAALGHPPEAIARITCPIGDPALGKHPQAIAIGVAHGLLMAPSANVQNRV
ncbi:xanthine dehydrogenase accessory protein XdhC [Jannaschia ovalis]|uniref:Xanthine dehydrogenase accessory protein XdhC n=1 Tax=Jannaschia ovalis TaxID=3038773 RepID=A0ABY8LBL5_9RHOB|nr:xanthine dehydrogenase accessory protein XdhC [Jannaschia sp. GRR-S6-38]WGH77549.1 xanthine dehydrogenase accessory protein XdhC [Jannaschia sp. GRR-S6-38]